MSGKVLVINEHGHLVPSEGEPGGTVSASEEALSLAVNGGGSGTGMSYYAVAARCGRRARLDTERRARFKAEGAPLPPSKNHFVVGSVYHKLMELAHSSDNKMALLDLNERWQNPSVAEGVRLFKGWLRTWGVGFWGRTIGCEVQLVDETTFAPAVVTAALDMVVYMDAEACERAKRRGLDLSPGHFLVDFKTSDGPSNGVSYLEGVQALWYTSLWNKQNPHAQVNGIIFDVVNKRARRKDRSVLLEDFQAHYYACGLESMDALAGLVQQGHENVEADRPNRAECVSWQGDICPYRLSGECSALV